MINICFFVQTIKNYTLFFLKKNTVLLKDLIPNNYIDIHSHLLPGIDDGAKSIEDTQELITELNKFGFTKFITTPHIMDGVWENTRSGIQNKKEETILDLKTAGMNFPLKAAAEYMMDGGFLKILESEKLLTLKDDYVLVEMSYLNPPMNLYDILFELQLEGYKPILAHPERYNFFHGSLSEYKKLKTVGCSFQINLLSTVGYYGPHVAKTAEYLLSNNMIDFTGSDVHHMKHVEFFHKKIVLKKHDNLITAFQNNLEFDF